MLKDSNNKLALVYIKQNQALGIEQQAKIA